MKTIEQKAKAYDKALERAKQVHKYSSDLAEIKRMEEIFPELVDSEDEKIRKEIMSYIKSSGAITNKQWIAWLEKQGKQKPEKKELKKINSYCQEHCKGYQETGKCFVDGGCNAKREAEKIENTSPLLSDFFNAEYERGKVDALQSIKWSEEDESMYTRTLGILGKCYMGKLPTKVEEELNWLKTLKERI